MTKNIKMLLKNNVKFKVKTFSKNNKSLQVFKKNLTKI